MIQLGAFDLSWLLTILIGAAVDSRSLPSCGCRACDQTCSSCSAVGRAHTALKGIRTGGALAGGGHGLHRPVVGATVSGVIVVLAYFMSAGRSA